VTPITTARRAIACGTAAAMQIGTGLGDRALIQNLLAGIKICF
jgi:fructose-1-phosphate kinase PfkB-like protein